MKQCVFSLATLVALTAFSATASGQLYEWRTFPDDAGVLALLENGRQIGVYYILEDTYRARLPGEEWSPPTCPPIQPPRRNFGVDTRHLHQGNHYLLNGKKVEREVIEQALQESGVKPREVENRKIPDDSSKQRVTVIGTRAQTEKVLEDFQSHQALKPFKDRLLVAAYEPTHWCIQRQGFATHGKPTIYVQDVDGTVLHRQDDYEGGAEELARVLRKIDPDYRPALDKDRRKLLPFKLPHIPWSVPVLAVLVVFLAIYYRRK
jgi:hypothetical protein